MPPKYVVAISRKPKPGKMFELVKAVLENQDKNSSEAGVTADIFSPSHMIRTTRGFDDINAVQLAVAGLFANDERQKQNDATSAMCDDVSAELFAVGAVPEGMESANFIRRFYLYHRAGERRALVEALEKANETTVGPKYGILLSLQQNLVLAAQATNDLTPLDQTVDAMQNDEAYQSAVADIFSYTEKWTAALAWVYR